MQGHIQIKEDKNMERKRLYIAYGSNLNVLQMKMRCPGARVIGTAMLKGYELLFKGSKTGSYLTIEPKKDSEVPVAVWEVSEWNEKSLDRYEGYPVFYYKQENIKLTCESKNGRPRVVYGFAYIMHESHELGIPSDRYVNVCLDGYESFGFDRKYLRAAYEKSEEVCA